MKTPNFTPQAIGAFLILIVSNVLILLGLDIGANREAALDTLLNASAITAFLVHDAIVRHGRAKISVAAIQNSEFRETAGQKIAETKVTT